MAVVNSEKEAENLRSLYFEYGPAKEQQGERDEIPTEPYETTIETIETTRTTYWFTEPTDAPLPETTQKPEPADGIVHIGFHDMFIEGEYLTVRSK